jgi:hypothetical protein
MPVEHMAAPTNPAERSKTLANGEPSHMAQSVKRELFFSTPPLPYEPHADA